MQQLVEKEISSRFIIMKRETAVSRLLEDIMDVILSMLPAKSIIRFGCVCKLWLQLFKKPDFIKMHLNHAVENNNYNLFLTASYKEPPSCYRVDFDATSASYLIDKAVKIDLPSAVHRKLHNSGTCVGSCNGILCFSRQNTLNDSVILRVWNPSTQECKEIVKHLHNSRVELSGFCYDCKINDYKLILVINDQSDLSEIHVYTLGSNSWRKIGNTLSAFYLMDSGYILNGAVHWLSRKFIVTGDQRAVTIVIASFNIAEEITKEIQIPSCQIKCELSNAMVGVLGKDLYFSDHVSYIFELWVMKDYGVLDSWTKILCISQKIENIHILRALPYLNKNGEIIFTCSRYEGNLLKDALVSYDLRSGRSTFLNINGMPGTFTAKAFIGSLVSLNSSR